MTTDFETEKATPSPIYDNNNLLIKKTVCNFFIKSLMLKLQLQNTNIFLFENRKTRKKCKF